MSRVAMTPFRAFKGVYDAEKETFTAQEEIPLARLVGRCGYGSAYTPSTYAAFLKGAVFGLAERDETPFIMITDQDGVKRELKYINSLLPAGFKGVTVNKIRYTPVVYNYADISYCVLMETMEIGITTGG